METSLSDPIAPPSAPSWAALRLVACLALSLAPLLAQDPVAADPQHYTVALDNSHARVLRVHYRPGEGSPMHEHTAGVRVFLTDIHNKFFLPNGSTSESSHPAGAIIWAEPVKHGNLNIGSAPVEILEMELKGLPKHPAHKMTPSPSPDPSETVVLENEFVRVLRVKLGGHQKSSQHAHSERVVVAMSDQHARVVDESGTAMERRATRGQVSWEPADTSTTENLEATPIETVLVEFKLALFLKRM
jgi:hypothetical protein